MAGSPHAAPRRTPRVVTEFARRHSPSAGVRAAGPHALTFAPFFLVTPASIAAGPPLRMARVRWRSLRLRLLGAVAWLLMPGLGWALPALAWPANLAPARREVLARGLAFLREHPAIPYKNAGADADGMDCSGAMVWLLAPTGLDVPRSAHGQFEWLKSSGRLTVVPASVRKPDDSVFATLQPGDLIFWAPDTPGATKEATVSHVHMYLGKELDGHPVMIGSSDGRGYRGKRMSGFGIVDFQVPKAGSPTRIIAFGSPFPSARPASVPSAGDNPGPPPPNPSHARGHLSGGPVCPDPHTGAAMGHPRPSAMISVDQPQKVRIECLL